MLVLSIVGIALVSIAFAVTRDREVAEAFARGFEMGRAVERCRRAWREQRTSGAEPYR